MTAFDPAVRHCFAWSEIVHVIHVKVLVIQDELLVFVVLVAAVLEPGEAFLVLVLTIELVIVVGHLVGASHSSHLMLQVGDVVCLPVQVSQLSIGTVGAVFVLVMREELLAVVDDVDFVVVDDVTVLIEFIILPIEDLLLLVWLLLSRHWLLA